MATSTADPYSLTILKIPLQDRSVYGLSKRFTCPTIGARLHRIEYKAGLYFQYTRQRIPTIQDWCSFHQNMMRYPYVCAIRGEPVKGLNPDRAQRLLANFPDTPRCPLFVDFDKPTLPRGPQGALAARALLPPAFHNAPCWWQRTASYGVDYEGRKGSSDPWQSRIRLGFMLDRPLDAPRIKRWLRGHQCDLAIYTANQINYTANPIFSDGAIDPVLAAGEQRFGTLDLDDAILDTVPVPDDIFDWVPSHTGTKVETRPATIADHKRQDLIREANECDAEEGERHGSVARWTFDAYGLGMDETEIINVATETLVRLGREESRARPEAARLLRGAQTALADGRLTVSTHHCPGQDFQPVDPSDPALTPATLTPAQASTQAANLINWWDRLKITPSSGAIKGTIDNAAIILANHSSMKDETGACILAYDTFQQRAVWTAPPPWWRSMPEKSRPVIGKLGVPVQEHDPVAAAVWLGHLDPAQGSEGTPIHIQDSMAGKAMIHVSRYRAVNPAQEYLNECAKNWDGVKRLSMVLEEVCHANGNPALLRQWFPKWLVQAVARTFNPGSKCDAVLVFTGGQGAKKSTFFATLCPFPEWFLDSLGDIRNKDAMDLLRGKMIVELSEMFAAKSDVDFLKGFLTKKDDTYRRVYGHDDARRPRTAVFCGSSNDEACLSDTGGRRWWMVDVPDSKDVHSGKRIDLKRTETERDQWWGEAVHLYRSGYEWWLDHDAEQASAQVALGHSAGMEQALDIAQWLTLPADRGGPINPDMVRSPEIWTGPLGRSMSQFHTGSGQMIAKLMKGVSGYRHVKFYVRQIHTTVRAYIKEGSKMDLDYVARNEYIVRHSTAFSNTPAADFKAAS